MKDLMLILLIIIVLTPYELYAQGKEIEGLWRKQLDSSDINIRKAMYLDVKEGVLLNILDSQPSFAMYKDNYFITGIPTNKEVTKYSTDAKFQISIRQRLTKSVLPLNSLLMLTFTQKSFWDIYQYSSPFADNNYNPGIAIAKPVVYNNRLIGLGLIAFEHESNGRSDSAKSRSWNYFVFTFTYFYNPDFSVQAKLWGGLAGSDNEDLFDYRGFALFAVNYRNIDDRFWITAIINPRKKLYNFNTQLEFNFKLNPKANQYLFVQWYNGYGESLLEYKQYTSMVRIGICIKPPLRNLY